MRETTVPKVWLQVSGVDAEGNPAFHRLMTASYRLTGCPVIINTSFNVRGEPIVCTPDDAYRCFVNTEMDYLVLGSYLLDKSEQPAFTDDARWRNEYQLD